MDVEKIRKDFPILNKEMNGKPLVYLDSAATSQKPQQVIDAVKNYYENYNSNVYRGLYYLSEESTRRYEEVREKVSKFINSKSKKEIIFTKNTTEALNLVMQSWGKKNIQKEDKIAVSIAEHHSSLIPWMQLAKEKGAELVFLECGKDGIIKNEEFEKIKGAKLIAITHISNVTGVINDVEKICKIAKENNCISLIDGSQSAPHIKIDVQKIGCDFFAFTGHKMLGPTGVGVLYGKEKILENMDPFMYGGEMMKEVHKDKVVWNDIPHRFEAGTPNIAGVIGLGAAIDYLENIGMDNIEKHDKELVRYTMEKIKEIKRVKIIGSEDSKDKTGILTFSIEGVHSHDIAAMLNEEGIAIRSGLHCAQPFHESIGVGATARASFYLYNNKQEIDKFIQSIEKLITIF